MPRPCLPPRIIGATLRAYATASPGFPIQSVRLPSSERSPVVPTELDEMLLKSLSASKGPSMQTLIKQYTERSGHILACSLPYESRPPPQRRVSFDSRDSVVLIAHCARNRAGHHSVTVSSGFPLAVPGHPDEGPLILTCAHTLEEIRRSPLLLDPTQECRSGSFLVYRAGQAICIHRVSRIVSSIPRSDLLLLQSESPALPTLPVSPYPVQSETAIRAHFVKHDDPQDSGWLPWIGSSWSSWVQGSVASYKDFAGRETQPGTYDSLSHMFFSPLPTPGSSGGPIVDEDSGAVVGVVLGTRMDNRVEGVRGWGVPSESIFEMFSLPMGS
ncbi:hypothetical protein R3P38DRAFT_2824474 [Favolaschia claudopus]|uniref:Uncharacterized protein n=1 Tax=Favolaschia claudopus TaxID=2862362 RepID=A0AAW0EIS1_9AGAR